MADPKKDFAPIEGIGEARKPAQTTPVRQEAAAARQAPARETGTVQAGGEAPQETVVLSSKAQEEAKKAQEEEAKKAEEEKAKEEEEKQKEYEEKIKELEKKIEDIQKQIADVLAQGDIKQAQILIGRLQDTQDELDKIKEAGPGGYQGWAPTAAPAGQPVASGIPGGGMTGGGFPVGGIGGGFPGGGVPSPGGFPAGDPTAGVKPANPNVQIPNFGPNPSKAEIGKMLDAASEKYGIPPNILKAVAWQESGWRANASSFDGGHGKGIMQIDDRFHEFARTQDVWDPAKNIDYGARYLAGLYKETGSWEAALKRYNGGSDYPPKVLALAQQQPWQQYA